MNLTHDQVQSLIVLARQHHSDAVAALYRAYVSRIARYIGYRVADTTIVEDLTAEVFLIMVEKLPQYELRGAPFEAWLYRIASTRIAEYYRTHSRQSQESISEHQPSSQPSPEATVQQYEQDAELQRALSHLTEEEQTILFLRFVERKKHQEIAAILGKQAQAVATAQHRALKRLAGLLKRDGGEL